MVSYLCVFSRVYILFLSIALLFICRCFAQENLLTHHSVLLPSNAKSQKSLREREREPKEMNETKLCSCSSTLNWVRKTHTLAHATKLNGQKWRRKFVVTKWWSSPKSARAPINVCKWYHIIAVSAYTNALWVCTHRTKSIFFARLCAQFIDFPLTGTSTCRRWRWRRQQQPVATVWQDSIV